MRLNQSCKKITKGFTLVEMIIAVAFLAVISVVMLRLFINAQNLGLKAHDLDCAVQLSKKMIETFKSGENPDELLKSQLLSGSDAKKSSTGTTVEVIMDKDWKVIDSSSKNSQKSAYFTAIIEISPSEFDKTVSSGSDSTSSFVTEKTSGKNGIYGINVRISKVKPYSFDEESKCEICRISAVKYFGNIPDRVSP